MTVSFLFMVTFVAARCCFTVSGLRKLVLLAIALRVRLQVVVVDGL